MNALSENLETNVSVPTFEKYFSCSAENYFLSIACAYKSGILNIKEKEKIKINNKWDRIEMIRLNNLKFIVFFSVLYLRALEKKSPSQTYVWEIYCSTLHWNPKYSFVRYLGKSM